MPKSFTKAKKMDVPIGQGMVMPVEFWETKTSGIVVTERPDSLSGYSVTHQSSGKRIFPHYITKPQATKLANCLGQLQIDWTMTYNQLFDMYPYEDIKAIVESAAQLVGIEVGHA